jgi:nucleoside-diphosphate-sugar epimerase
MMDLVLLTGPTGFVGRHVLDLLLLKKKSVRLVVREGTQCLPSSPHIESILWSEDIFSESVEWWTSVTSGVTTVIHSAWYAEPGKYLNAVENLNCISGTLRLAQGAAASGVDRFVGIGTCFEYKLGDSPVTIDTELQPSSIYASAKAAVYQTLMAFFKEAKISFSWCRLFYIFGDGEDVRRLVPYVRSKLEIGECAELSSGTQVRDYMNVRDAAESIISIAFSNHEGAANICSGRPITIREFVEEIADQYKARHLLRFGARVDLVNEPYYVVGTPSEIPSSEK